MDLSSATSLVQATDSNPVCATYCEACRNVFERKAELSNELIPDVPKARICHHHKDVESLRSAAEDQQCFFCRALWAQFSPAAWAIIVAGSGEERPGGPTQTLVSVAELYSDYRLRLALFQQKERRPGSSPSKYVVVADFGLTGKSFLTPAEFRCSSTAFPGARPLAFHWIQTCCSSHKLCNENRGRGSWNPTRLLDLNPQSSGQIVLVETHLLTEALRYTTLSHRWGKGHFLQLNKATEPQLKTGIMLSELPRTFVQAAEVTLALGVRYLWIDCLCIVQATDDLSDWLRESALMHKVYTYGHFNISALRCVDSSSSLYANRDRSASAFTEIELTLDDPARERVPYIAYNSGFWQRNVEEAELNSRGWVLQERLLAKRILHFGENQLFWECRELQAAENFPDGDPQLEWPPGPSRAYSRLLLWKAGQMYASETYSMWDHIIEAYSKCSLTNPGDKLPAIMGIAKQVSGVLQDTYVAGMWKDRLVNGLAWYRLNIKPLGRRPKTIQAPSWSWASVDSGVCCAGNTDCEARLHIEEISLDYASEDPFGPLDGGRLLVKGILRRVMIHEDLSAAVAHPWSLTFPSLLSADTQPRFFEVWIDWAHEDFSSENEAGLLFCIDFLKTDAFVYCMLLQVEDAQSGLFSRIGLCRERFWWTTTSRRQEGKADLPCVSWDKDTGEHTICII